jgi:hypothetical protein
MGTNDFTCSQSGTIVLRHGAGSTDLIQDLVTILSEPGDAETLNITCGAEPTPTPTPLPTLVSSGSGSAAGQSGTGETGLWLAIGALLVLTGAAAVVSGTYARRRQ